MLLFFFLQNTYDRNVYLIQLFAFANEPEGVTTNYETNDSLILSNKLQKIVFLAFYKYACIMCSSEASISQAQSDLFKQLSSFTRLYIKTCHILFMQRSFLLWLLSLEQLEIKSVGKCKMYDSVFYHVPKLTS